MTQLFFMSFIFIVFAADMLGQEARVLWRWNSPSKITMHAVVLPSRQLFVSSDKATMLLSADGSKVLWSREDLVSCGKSWPPSLGLNKVPEIARTCRVDGKFMFVSFFGRYLRLETSTPATQAAPRSVPKLN